MTTTAITKHNTHEIIKSSRVTISFTSPEGLNLFTEFLFRKNIKGLGFETSDKNTEFSGIFTEAESKLIEKYLQSKNEEQTV